MAALLLLGHSARGEECQVGRLTKLATAFGMTTPEGKGTAYGFCAETKCLGNDCVVAKHVPTCKPGDADQTTDGDKVPDDGSCYDASVGKAPSPFTNVLWDVEPRGCVGLAVLVRPAPPPNAGTGRAVGAWAGVVKLMKMG